MTLDNDIVCAEQDNIGKELELKILNGINNINTTILQMQKDINQYEDLGFEVNDLKSFTNNYPFQISFDEFSELNCWGSDGDEEFLNKEPLPQNTGDK